MISADDFENSWKGSELSKLNKDSFLKKFISSQSAEFLIKAGLPERTFCNEKFAFDLSEDALVCFDEKLNKVPTDSNSIRYIKISQQNLRLTCVDIENGEIYKIWNKSLKKEYVCSGFFELAELTLIFDESYDKFRNKEIDLSDKQVVSGLLDRLENECRRIDPKVIENNTIWTRMIYELRSYFI